MYCVCWWWGYGGHVDVSCVVFVGAGGTGVMLIFRVLCLLVVGVRESC